MWNTGKNVSAQVFSVKWLHLWFLGILTGAGDFKTQARSCSEHLYSFVYDLASQKVAVCSSRRNTVCRIKNNSRDVPSHWNLEAVLRQSNPGHLLREIR